LIIARRVLTDDESSPSGATTGRAGDQSGST
jgi:hypothetical protein